MELKGGEKSKSVLAHIKANLGDGNVLRVGFLEGATYPDGTSVAMVAATNEFGRTFRKNAASSYVDAYGNEHTSTIKGGSVGTQPPRPFFRNMIAAHKDEWPDAIAALMVANDYKTEKVLWLAAEGIMRQLRQSIHDLTEPPLAPSTILRKGFSKPLIDKGDMYNSVAAEVKTGEVST